MLALRLMLPLLQKQKEGWGVKGMTTWLAHLTEVLNEYLP